MSVIKGKGYYQSISDISRLRKMCDYFEDKKIILIDRDGTINERPKKGCYVTCWDEFKFKKDTVRAMENLAEKGFRFIVISNQAGIGRGIVEREVVDEINMRMSQELKEKGIEILDIMICPHHWDDNCQCRKPKPGNFYKAAIVHNLNLENTIYIGDDIRDEEASINCGCTSLRLTENEESISILESTKGKYRNLVDATDEIIKWFNQKKRVVC